jgi:hypothetical protein
MSAPAAGGTYFIRPTGSTVNGIRVVDSTVSATPVNLSMYWHWRDHWPLLIQGWEVKQDPPALGTELIVLDFRL